MTKFLDKLSHKLGSTPVKIVFPEGDNEKIKQTAKEIAGIIEPILLTGEDALQRSVEMVANGEADSIIAGIDITSRDVILAVRDHIGSKSKTFSAPCIVELPDNRVYVVADCGACKNPTAEQLKDIVLQAVELHQAISDEKIYVAMLSFSTFGSGGKDQSFETIHDAIKLVRESNPETAIDGEMQLDTAVSPEISKKKAPNSSVAGRANILITPDLNCGNILYKSMEQFAGGYAYGPILQGFNVPVSDLSRGSTVQDIVGVAIVTAARINKLRE